MCHESAGYTSGATKVPGTHQAPDVFPVFMVPDVFPVLSWRLMCSRNFHGTWCVPGTFMAPDVFPALSWSLISSWNFHGA